MYEPLSRQSPPEEPVPGAVTSGMSLTQWVGMTIIYRPGACSKRLSKYFIGGIGILYKTCWSMGMWSSQGAEKVGARIWRVATKRNRTQAGQNMNNLIKGHCSWWWDTGSVFWLHPQLHIHTPCQSFHRLLVHALQVLEAARSTATGIQPCLQGSAAFLSQQPVAFLSLPTSP